MQVVITAAGQGSRFQEQGYSDPKPLVSIAGRPAISYLIQSFAKTWSLFFVLGEHYRETELEKTILEYAPKAKIIYSNFSHRGPIDTVQASINFLDTKKGVLISYCDLVPLWKPENFEKAVQVYDMAVVNYQGFHPTYLGPNSYCHVQVDTETNQVLRLQEKKLFTEHLQSEVTSAGLYYFKSVELLNRALNEQLHQGLKFGKEYYISLAVQAMLNQSGEYKVLDYRIEHLVQMGTPADLQRFDFWYQYLVQNKNIDQIVKKLIWNSDFDFEVEKKYWVKVFDCIIYF